MHEFYFLSYDASLFVLKPKRPTTTILWDQSVVSQLIESLLKVYY